MVVDDCSIAAMSNLSQEMQQVDFKVLEREINTILTPVSHEDTR